MNQPQEPPDSPAGSGPPAAGHGQSATGGQTLPYGAPGDAPPGQDVPAGQGYGTPPGQGYGTPPGQYPAYQPSGYGQPYPGYASQVPGRDPALAEWWRRLLARVIDGFILAVLFSPLWIPPWRTFFRTVRSIANQYPAGTQLSTVPAAKNAIATAEGHLAGKLFVVALGFYLVAFLYDWVQHWLWGQTIGKRALGTVVVKADGRPRVGSGAASGRAAIYALSPIVPAVGWIFDLVNELWLTWDPRRQCLHDKAANTVVIKKSYQGSPPQAGNW